MRLWGYAAKGGQHRCLRFRQSADDSADPSGFTAIRVRDAQIELTREGLGTRQRAQRTRRSQPRTNTSKTIMIMIAAAGAWCGGNKPDKAQTRRLATMVATPKPRAQPAMAGIHLSRALRRSLFHFRYRGWIRDLRVA